LIKEIVRLFKWQWYFVCVQFWHQVKLNLVLLLSCKKAVQRTFLWLSGGSIFFSNFHTKIVRSVLVYGGEVKERKGVVKSLPRKVNYKPQGVLKLNAKSRC